MAPQSRSLSSKDVYQGNVLWLASHSDTLASFRRRGHAAGGPVFSVTKQAAAEPGVYDHPILIVSRSEESQNSIRFLVLTSFKGGKNITKRFSKSAGRHEWPNYLAVFPAEHPLHAEGNLTYQPLRFEDDGSTKQPSYIKISEVFEMDWRDAEPHWHRQTRSHSKAHLDAASLRVVLAATGRLARYTAPKKQYDGRSPAVVSSTKPKPSAELVRSGSNTISTFTSRKDSRKIDRSLVSNSPEPDHTRTGIEHVRRGKHVGEREPLLPLHRRPRSLSEFDGRLGSRKWASRLVRLFSIAIVVGIVMWLAVLVFKRITDSKGLQIQLIR